MIGSTGYQRENTVIFFWKQMTMKVFTIKPHGAQ